MAQSDDSQEKTEEATDARREEFRKRGEVAQTRELASALFLAVSGGLVLFAGGHFYSVFHKIFYKLVYLLESSSLTQSEKWAKASQIIGESFLYLVGPVLLISLVIGLSSYLIQSGFIYVENAFRFHFERIDPVQGFRRIFSLRSVNEGLKALIKFTIFLGIAGLIIKKEVALFLRLPEWDLVQSLKFIGYLSGKLLLIGAAFLILLAVLDYFFNRWQLEKKMMMSKQELKEEMKNREVDPQIKARLRKMQRDLAQRRMMNEVPKADVIITNPTHIAVALRYTPDMPAPKLIAKGADRIAEKIKEIARAHNIPIVENKPLARVIYKTLKLDQFIPRELYVAVAEVLSYVYRLKRKRRPSAEV